MIFMWVLRPVKIISLIFEPSQSLGGAKTNKNRPDHPQAELRLSHM